MALLDALSPSDRARALKRLAKLQLKEQEAQQVCYFLSVESLSCCEHTPSGS